MFRTRAVIAILAALMACLLPATSAQAVGRDGTGRAVPPQRLVIKTSGKCFDIGKQDKEWIPVVQAPCDDTRPQQGWVPFLHHEPAGMWGFKNVHYNECIWVPKNHWNSSDLREVGDVGLRPCDDTDRH